MRTRIAHNSARVKVDGDYIRLILRRRGLRQGQLAKRLKITDAALSYYLSGKTTADQATVAAMAYVLSVDPSSILFLPEGDPSK